MISDGRIISSHCERLGTNFERTRLQHEGAAAPRRCSSAHGADACAAVGPRRSRAARAARRRRARIRDPRDGTWGDNPVGGAAERDGSWLDQDTRAAIKAALDGLAARDRHALAKKLTDRGSASLEVASGERYCVRVLALEAGGAAVRETHPSGTVVMSRCVAGRCSAVPLRRIRCDQPWELELTSARTRRRADGCWTSLGGPPRGCPCAGARPALVLSVALKPPVEQSIALDGGDDAARRGESCGRRRRGVCRRDG